jgi:hypothetical protein
LQFFLANFQTWTQIKNGSNSITVFFPVTKKTILFAAHCVQDKGESVARKPKDSYFLLGRYDLEKQEDGSVKALVEKFIVHPLWDIELGTKYAGNF